MSRIITKEIAETLESFEYLGDIFDYLDKIQQENDYTDEEMDNDLDVALWRAYVYNNMDSYEYYELSEKTLAKVKDEGIKNGVWCYRYSCALVYLRRFDEALEYSRLGTKTDPAYPWGWLQLGRLCYKYNLLEEAYAAIDKGLKLVPNDYEFLTLKDDIENDRGYAYANSHYIDEETDKNYSKRLIDIDNEELYQSFINKSDLEKKLDILHKEDKNQEIIDIITSLPKEELNYNILGKLARAYNNNNECEKGKEILLSVKEEGENDSLWNFRLGYSYYYSENFGQNPHYLEEAEKYFEKCLELNPEEPDGDTLLRFVYSDLGNRRLNEEKSDEALEYFKKARNLAKDKNDIMITESELAWAYDFIGKYEEAYEHLQTVISLGRDDIWVNSELGYCLAGLGKYQEAIEKFEKSVELGRNDEWIYARLGSVYKELEKFDIALENYQKALEAEPENIYVLCEIAWIYDNIKNDCTKGLEYLNKAKELGRDDIWINCEIGWAYDHISQYEEALPYLEKAKNLGRDDEWINTEIGFCLNRLEKYDEALLYLERALELGKNNKWFYSEMGYCLKKLENYDRALENYKKSEEMGRNDEWIVSETAECLENLGQTENAIEKLKSFVVTEEGNTTSINSQIAYLYGKMNNSEEALKYLYEAEKLGRSDIWLYSEIGWNLSAEPEKYEEALIYFEKAVELGRDDEWINGQIGFVLSKTEKNKEAVMYLEKANFINPDSSWISYHLGACYRKLGEIQKATEILKPLSEKGEYKGWTELELAWCYALIDEKEEAQKYLKEADSYISGEIINSPELKKDFDTIKTLISNTSYLA